MPRKKSTPIEPTSEFETPAATTAQKTTLKRKPAKSAPKQGDDFTSELKDLLGEDAQLLFREKTVSDMATEKPRREARTASTKEVTPKPTRATKKDSSSETWDEELPIPTFRTVEATAPKPARAPVARPISTRVSEAPAESKAREPRRRERKPAATSQEFVTDRTGSEPSEDRGESLDLLEFTPTETFEIEDVVVQMRTARVFDKKPSPAAKRTTITPKTDSPKTAEKQIVPPRALIEVPTDAPQVVIRDGQPVLVRNGKVFPNFWFNASWPENPQTVIDEVRQASEAGINIFSFRLEAITDARHFDDLIMRSKEILKSLRAISSDIQVIFSLDLVAPKGWEMEFPEGVYRDRKGDLSEPSISDDKYWGHVESLLVNYTKALSETEFGANILGVEFDRNSWLIDEKNVLDISLASKSRFKDWVRDRYQDDTVLLRASWFDGLVDFDNIRIPELEKANGRHRMVREARKERSYVDYFLFLSDQTMYRIDRLAYAVKEASDGRFVVGVRYGLTLEDATPGSGQLSLGKLLRTPEIDFVIAPPSYNDRQPGGSAPFPVPVDSFALNGKLFVSLEDFKTSLSNRPEPDQQNPVMRTPQALESVHFRGFGAALSHNSGVCWSDQWGNGWLTAASVWQRAKSLRDLQIRSMAAQTTETDVAVFIDERALAYLVGTKAFSALVQQVRESVLRAGVSVGFYLLSDLTHREKFPESKLYVFLNGWDIRPDLRGAIKQRLHRDGKVLFWLYAAGIFDSGRETLERAREVTGIALKPQPIFSKSGTTILDRRNPIAQSFTSGQVSTEYNLEPTYFAIPENGSVLGEYTQTGLPSFVVRDVQGEEKNSSWVSAFLGEPTVNPALIRALAQRAGAHVWSFNDDVVHVRAPFLTVHCKGEGQRTIAMPGKWSAYNLQSQEWTVIDSTHLRFTSPDGATHSFLVGTTDDIRKILEADTRSLLKMSELPARESNIRVDVSNFDVPIMRLGEWANEAEVEDSSIDSYFFKPQEEDDYEEDASLAPGAIQRTTGRRRRDRRGKRKESFADQVDFDPTGEEKLRDSGEELNILFRKRD
jgi:hypothetical protein